MGERGPVEADCVFCRIVAGDLPAAKVYEDDVVLAFLDISPVARGHVVLIPKAHHRDQLDTPPELLARIAGRIPAIAAGLMQATGAEGFNLFQCNRAAAGQEVFHLHYHIIPRREGDRALPAWTHVDYADGEAAQLARQVRNSVQG